MKVDGEHKLQPSSSRNFSRPLPSPLSIATLITPIKQSKQSDVWSRLPSSATLFSLSKPRTIDHSPTANNLDPTDLTNIARPTNGFYSRLPSNEQKHSRNPRSAVEARSEHLSPSVSSSNHSVIRPTEKLTSDTWALLAKDAQEISLDLFRPIAVGNASGFESDENAEDEPLPGSQDPSVIPIVALKPILQYCQLRHLKLTGMMQSYQSLIWAICWLSPFLQTVHLEMALPPVFTSGTDHPNRSIDSSWSLDNSFGFDPDISEYLGHHGDGTLHEEFGEGEYLDSQAINMAQDEHFQSLPFNNTRYLPIEKLTLVNFCVDGGSFRRWFDPKRLQEIEFRYGCVDAGFYLAEDFSHIEVTSPQPKSVHQYGRTPRPGDLKIVEFKEGKIVGRRIASQAKGGLHLPPRLPVLKAKLSNAMLYTFGQKGKENKALEKRSKSVDALHKSYRDVEVKLSRDEKKTPVDRVAEMF